MLSRLRADGTLSCARVGPMKREGERISAERIRCATIAALSRTRPRER